MIQRTASALALLAGSTLAADLTRTGGVLGSGVTYDLVAAPTTLFALGVSLSNGPTPLALLDPTDPRVLDLGLELLPFWTVGFTSPAGTASATYALPASPGLAGAALHAQAVEITIMPTYFGALTSLRTVTLGLTGTSSLTFGEAHTNLAGHTATELGDGRVLLAGGYADPVGAVSSIGIYDPQTETTALSAATLSSPRFVHTATMLDDGRVLLVGGLDQTEAVVPTADVYDPATDSVMPTAAMADPRALHTATKLLDGRVLVVGGGTKLDSDVFTTLASIVQTCEIFDPATGAWSPAPGLPLPRGAHAASRLADGRVLVTGGIEVVMIFGLPTPFVSSDVRIYNPATNSWSAGATMPGVRALHAQLTLADGRVVVAGGANAVLAPLSVTPLATTATYFPTVNAWVPGATMNVARGYCVLFESGPDIYVMGGMASVDLTGINPDTPGEKVVERTDQALLAWNGSMSLVKARMFGGAFTSIEGGARILVTGEADDNDPLTFEKTCEMFTP